MFDSLLHRTPKTAVTIGTEVTLNVPDMTAVAFTYDMETTSQTLPVVDGQVTFTPDRAGLWWYRLQQGDVWYGAPKAMQEGEAVVDGPAYQLTVVTRLEAVPEWYQDARFYHIFVDRFNNGNDDGQVNAPKPDSFLYGQLSDLPMYVKDANQAVVRWDFYGGNLQGIIKKLPYLEDLGVNALYLSPIFEARSNHRYDTGDYHKLDPMLGQEEDFDALVHALHARGMHLVLDGVFNHVGAASRYFNAAHYYPADGALDREDSPYYDWFVFDHFPDDYQSWWGVKDLPAIKKDSDSFQAFIAGTDDAVVNQWTARGVDGWRLDVADELSDPFLRRLRSTLNEFSGRVLIGEVWEDASNKIAYGKRRPYLNGDMLQAVMNYPLRQWLLDFANGDLAAQELVMHLLTMQSHYPEATFAYNFNNLGSHDTPRLLTMVGEDLAKLTIAVTLFYTLPGIPVLYYGDEAGLTGGKDPANRAFYPWGRENQQVLNLFKQMLALRQNERALKGAAPMAPFAFTQGFGVLRGTVDNAVLVLTNPSAEEALPNTADLRYVPKGFHKGILAQGPLAAKSVRTLRL